MLKEVHLLERLRHPNIIEYKHAWLENRQLTVFGPEVPCLFVLMELANGGNLEEYIYVQWQPPPTTTTRGVGQGAQQPTTTYILLIPQHTHTFLLFFHFFFPITPPPNLRLRMSPNRHPGRRITQSPRPGGGSKRQCRFPVGWEWECEFFGFLGVGFWVRVVCYGGGGGWGDCRGGC